MGRSKPLLTSLLIIHETQWPYFRSVFFIRCDMTPLKAPVLADSKLNSTATDTNHSYILARLALSASSLAQLSAFCPVAWKGLNHSSPMDHNIALFEWTSRKTQWWPIEQSFILVWPHLKKLINKRIRKRIRNVAIEFYFSGLQWKIMPQLNRSRSFARSSLAWSTSFSCHAATSETKVSVVTEANWSSLSRREKSFAWRRN